MPHNSDNEINQSFRIPRSKEQPKGKGPEIPLLEKVKVIERVKQHGDSPKDLIPPLYQRFGRTVPKKPGQALSSWIRELESLVRKGDAEAVRLAHEYLEGFFALHLMHSAGAAMHDPPLASEVIETEVPAEEEPPVEQEEPATEDTAPKTPREIADDEALKKLIRELDSGEAEADDTPPKPKYVAECVEDNYERSGKYKNGKRR